MKFRQALIPTLSLCALAMACGNTDSLGENNDNLEGDGGGTGGSSGTGGATGLDGSAATGGSENGGGTGGGANSGELACQGACCPTEPSCYGLNVPEGYGDECFAQRPQGAGSPNAKRLQFKATWGRAMAPAGTTAATIYQVLSTGANLPWPQDCNQSGLGVAMQLMDVDLTGANLEDHRARIGWAPNMQDAGTAAEARLNGLCMIEGAFSQTDYNLPQAQMSSSSGWPEGLPPPMARGERGQAATTPWQVKPTVLKRVANDFDVATDRTALLGTIAASSTDGVFFIDEDAGVVHTYAPLTWMVVTLGTAIAIPIREAESTHQLNDAGERACIGAYRAHALATGDGCRSPADQQNPEWGWYADAEVPGSAPSRTKGYFLTTELEQIYSATLGQTLCVAFPGTDSGASPLVAAQGFFDPTTQSCASAQWDPMTAGGLPRGDWCAATNSPATAECHDAFRHDVFQTFQAFPIQDGVCPGGFPGQ